MNTVILMILLSNLILEAVCAYLLYKKRHLVKQFIRDYVGFSETQARLGSLEHEVFLVAKRTKFIRKAQKEPAKTIMVGDMHFSQSVAKDEKVVQVLRSTRSIIEAIKTYRNLYGSTLKDAKDRVELIRDNLRAQGENI